MFVAKNTVNRNNNEHPHPFRQSAQERQHRFVGGLCLNFFHIEDAGRVLVRGAKEKGGVRDTKALEEAETLGRTIVQ